MNTHPLASHRYMDKAFHTAAVRVLPGEYFYTQDDVMLVTLLGSCVTACIRDRVTGVGGMNHFLLPESRDASNPISESMRYGTYAMEILINDLFKAGAKRPNLEAKVFGGANVIESMTTMAVGSRNAEFVLNFLHTDGISVVVQDLGGVCPRKICYFPRTGKAWVKKLIASQEDTVMQQEARYQRQIKLIKAGELVVDLF